MGIRRTAATALAVVLLAGCAAEESSSQDAGGQDFRTLEGNIDATPVGIAFEPEEDVSRCSIEVNPGTISSGYTADFRADPIPGGDRAVVAWGDLTDGDSQRFNPEETAPERVNVHCDNADGELVTGMWEF